MPDESSFGQRIRALRKAASLTLDEVAANGGLSRAALSKIERDEMSPTFDSLLKVARGLGTDVGALVSGKKPAGGSLEVTRDGKGRPHRADKRFPSRLLAPNLPDRALHAFITEVRAVPIEKYGPWDSHDSEDFYYVLEGRMVVYLEGREPVELGPGDSLQVDGRIRHALVASPTRGSRKGSAKLLWVSVPFGRREASQEPGKL